MSSSQQSLATSREDPTESIPVGSDEPLKILRVASDLYPEVMGGLSLHVHEMSRLQAEWGHDVTVLTSDHGNRGLPSKEKRDGYELIRHREVVSPLDNTITPGIALTVWKLADEYDIIHAHSHLFFSTDIVAALNRTLETPLVITNHGLISQTAPKWVQKVFIPTVATFTLNSADRVLCYTETDKHRLRERDVNTAVSVIHNGINCEKFIPRETENSKNPQILFVGRLKPGKGVDNLLIAFEDVVEKIPQSTLKIVGNGPLRNELIQKAKTSGISSQVQFVGQVLNDRMPEIYAESDVFALPSMNEGLPRTVLEAMACSIPVVTSSLPQLEPLVDTAGFVVDPKAPDQLADSLLDLLEHPDKRERMGAAGRKKVERNYSWQETVRRTNETYTELINDS
ncbi:glycosyltransferase family 4 protein [Natronorarus salvus]|uniref:glycosyltransferase family 4 protein n=1 Tax=Natronorarus salvus TaxID=3117733 RepID=UPI002F267357